MCSQCEFDACLIYVVQLGVRVQDRFSCGAVRALSCLNSAVKKTKKNKKTATIKLQFQKSRNNKTVQSH